MKASSDDKAAKSKNSQKGGSAPVKKTKKSNKTLLSFGDDTWISFFFGQFFALSYKAFLIEEGTYFFMKNAFNFWFLIPATINEYLRRYLSRTCTVATCAGHLESCSQFTSHLAANVNEPPRACSSRYDHQNPSSPHYIQRIWLILSLLIILITFEKNCPVIPTSLSSF